MATLFRVYGAGKQKRKSLNDTTFVVPDGREKRRKSSAAEVIDRLEANFLNNFCRNFFDRAC
jgi:hypothetical protein